ncbi:hypothetical protein RB595_005543 [Gaeumannomyces hyphopodioides]
MRRLLDTIRGRKRRRSDKEINSSVPPPPSLPLLPAQRERPITPPATTTAAAVENLVAALGTFACLPPELRRRVLVAAFGDRTLHLDLRLAPRGKRASGSVTSADKYEHGRGTAPLSLTRLAVVGWGVPGEMMAGKYVGSKIKSDWAEWEWCWYGCVCHRLLPRGSAIERRIFTARGRSLYIWPHRDSCIHGRADLCEVWPPPGPATEGTQAQVTSICDYAVGALGWLRACRQAYVEGIDVLYATNTFFLESRDLLDILMSSPPDLYPHIPDAGRRLLLPERLAMIRSLELRWETLLFGDPPRPSPYFDYNKDRMRLLPNLANLMVPFPNLRSLVVSFSAVLYSDWRVRPAARLPEIDRLLLRPVALALAHIAPQLEKQAVVELPSNVFCDLKGLGLEEEQQVDEWGKGGWLRYPIRDSFYYIIKEGEESDLFWDHKGNPRSISHMINNGGDRAFV